MWLTLILSDAVYEQIARHFSAKFEKKITRKHVAVARKHANKTQTDQSAEAISAPRSTEVALVESSVVTVKVEPESDYCTVVEMSWLYV